eukprot:COSAG05_NODE_2265_length_3314_cov_55.001758_1_plen_22_part_10
MDNFVWPRVLLSMRALPLYAVQ